MKKYLPFLFFFISTLCSAQENTIKVQKKDTLCKGYLTLGDTTLFKDPFIIGGIIIEGISSQKLEDEIRRKLSLHKGDYVKKSQIKEASLRVCFVKEYTLDNVLASRGKKGSTLFHFYYSKAGK